MRRSTLPMIAMCLVGCGIETEGVEPPDDGGRSQAASSTGGSSSDQSSSLGAATGSSSGSSSSTSYSSTSSSSSSNSSSSSSSSNSSSSGGSSSGSADAGPPCVAWSFNGSAGEFTLDNDVVLAAVQSGSGVDLEATGGDPFLSTIATGNADLDACRIIEVTFSATTSSAQSLAQFFWLRGDNTGYFTEAQGRFFEIIIDGNRHTYRVDMGTHPQWRGTLAALRFDPPNAVGSYNLLSIEIRRNPSTGGGGDGGAAGCGSCGANSSCVNNACQCDAGYVLTGAGCVLSSGGDLQSRSDAEVCSIYEAGAELNASQAWQQSSGDACDLGVLSEGAKDDATRRVNMWRSLVGLPASVVRNHDDEQAMQECALIQEQLGWSLNHHPSSDTPCYTASGAGAAGRANLAKGIGTPAQAIDLFIDDSGVASLGHRRWILNPGMDKLAVGQVGSSNCTGVFYWGGNADPPFVAYPPPGPFPFDAVRGAWSIDLTSHRPTESTKVTVTRRSDNVVVFDGGTMLGGGYGSGRPVISFSGEKRLNESYEIRVTNLRTYSQEPAEIAFVTRFINCQ